MHWPWARASMRIGCRCLLLCGALAAAWLATYRQTGRATGAGWQVVAPVTSSPPPRSQYGMAADGHGHLYLYGGNGGQGTGLSDFWVYDTTAGSWQPLPNGVVPPLIEAHLAVDAQGQVWEFGGIADPDAPHLTADGHSYGLYEYLPVEGTWRDMTPPYPALGQTWPPGREDHGFAFDVQAGRLVVFAGEGQGSRALNDMWTYSVGGQAWTQVAQQYAGSGGAAIAPREIYNISADTSGHLYLFGGSYLEPPPYGAGTNAYANDTWRYDDASQTWVLLAGVPNGYDPSQPLPRHYYGQTVDAEGDFDILGGYLDAPEDPPYFGQGAYARYALPFQFASGPVPGSYGLSDFWQFNPSDGWRDRSDAMGALAGKPLIPYGLVADPSTGHLYTFGGFHLAQGGLLSLSDSLWSLDENDLADPPTATATATAPPSATQTATPSPSPTAKAHHFPSPTATAHATAVPSPTVPLIASSVTKTMVAGPYVLTLTLGPPEALYSPAQVLARHPTTGEEVLSGTDPTGQARARGPAPNRHVELTIHSAATGKAVTDAEVAIAITTPAGKLVQRVPILVLERIAGGPSPWRFGNNLTLPAGRYHLIVRAGQANATFDVLLSR